MFIVYHLCKKYKRCYSKFYMGTWFVKTKIYKFTRNPKIKLYVLSFIIGSHISFTGYIQSQIE